MIFTLQTDTQTDGKGRQTDRQINADYRITTMVKAVIRKIKLALWFEMIKTSKSSCGKSILDADPRLTSAFTQGVFLRKRLTFFHS